MENLQVRPQHARQRSGVERRLDAIPPIPLWAWVVTIPVLILLGVWIIELESRLPGLHVPLQPTGTILYPGTHGPLAPELQRTGEWVHQPLGDVTSLASTVPDSSIQIRFYGTEVRCLLRFGPEAGQAYIAVDGKPVSALASDQHGTYVDLYASEAEHESTMVVTGLTHREHTLTITAGDEGEVALAGIDIVAQTPVPWAFALLYGVIGILLVVAVRQAGLAAFRSLGWLATPRPEDDSEPAAHSS